MPSKKTLHTIQTSIVSRDKKSTQKKGQVTEVQNESETAEGVV